MEVMFWDLSLFVSIPLDILLTLICDNESMETSCKAQQGDSYVGSGYQVEPFPCYKKNIFLAF